MTISYSSPPINLADAPNGYLEGFRVKSYSDRRQRLVLQPGRAVFIDPATGFRYIGVLSTPLEKRFIPFSVGDGNGGIASGTMSATEDWYVFAIYNLATGQIDMCFSEDPNCGDCPVGWIFRYLFFLEIDSSVRPFRIFEQRLPSELGINTPVIITNTPSFFTQNSWATWVNLPSVNWSIYDPFNLVDSFISGLLTLSRRGIYRIKYQMAAVGGGSTQLSTWITRIAAANPLDTDQISEVGPYASLQLLGDVGYINQFFSSQEVDYEWTSNNGWNVDNTSEILKFQYYQIAVNQGLNAVTIPAAGVLIRIRPLAFFDVIEV